MSFILAINIFVATTLQNTVLFLFLQIQCVATGLGYEKHAFGVRMVRFFTCEDGEWRAYPTKVRGPRSWTRAAHRKTKRVMV